MAKYETIERQVITLRRMHGGIVSGSPVLRPFTRNPKSEKDEGAKHEYNN